MRGSSWPAPRLAILGRFRMGIWRMVELFQFGASRIARRKFHPAPSRNLPARSQKRVGSFYCLPGEGAMKPLVTNSNCGATRAQIKMAAATSNGLPHDRCGVGMGGRSG